MSSEGKIKSKDLRYESTLPPFLQRLHAQNSGRGDQDRHEREIARPKRVQKDDEDDGPTVVDESGETVSKEDWEKMSRTEAGVEDGGNVTGDLSGNGDPVASGALPSEGAEGPKSTRKLTDGTSVKKRKAAKVVGEEDATQETAGSESPVKENSRPKKARKKAKPIKLAFDDGEDG